MGKKEDIMTDRPTQEITLHYADCNNRFTHEALEKLDNFTDFADTKDLYRFAKIKATFDREYKKFQSLFQKLVKKHAIQDPVTEKDPTTGEERPVLDKNGTPTTRPRMIPNSRGHLDIAFKNPKAFDEDYKLLVSTAFTVKAPKLLTTDLLRAKLTPKELRACAKLIEDIDPDMLEELTADEPEIDDTIPRPETH
jgi:hypothetical protein